MSEFNLSPARQKFLQIARLPDRQLDPMQLFEAALAIAWEEYPRIDLEHYRQQLAHMSDELRSRLAGVTYPMKMINIINQYLCQELGFKGNEDDYYNPRNSFITDVIDRRKGIPITLSLIYMAIGNLIDFPIEGISLPGHFIVRPQRQDLDVFLDPFNCGEVMFPEDCAAKLQQVYGRAISLRSEYLEPIGTRRILERILMNLKLIYLRRNEPAKALAAIEKILMLLPDSPMQLRDRGLLYYQMERYIEAKIDLESYLAHAPNAPDAGIVSRLIAEMPSA
jgi:regulator of sirC expression with transglutaminase-like and TPR domain